MVRLDDRVDPGRPQIQDALDEALPGAVVLAQQIEQGPPFVPPVEMHLYGPDLARLREHGEKIGSC